MKNQRNDLGHFVSAVVIEQSPAPNSAKILHGVRPTGPTLVDPSP
ncbi:MAG: hypothetical protein R3C09_14220 [Pirellulaceae bacterium]